MEKVYQFTRQAVYLQFGTVTAKDEKEARQKIIDGEYDDIFDTSLESEDNDTIEIEESEDE